MWTSNRTLMSGALLVVLMVFPGIAQAGIVSVESRAEGPYVVPLAVNSSSFFSLQVLEVFLPVYPLAARRARMPGVVQLAGVIDADGRVLDLKCVTCGGDRPGFTAAAMKAISTWTYERPASADGSPITVSVLFQVRFTP